MWFLLGLSYLCLSSGKNLVSSLPLMSCRFCGCGICTQDTSPHFQDSAEDTWFCQVSADAFGWKRWAQLSKRSIQIIAFLFVSCLSFSFSVVVFTCSSSHCYAFRLESNATYRKQQRKHMYVAQTHLTIHPYIWAHMKSLLRNADLCLWYSGCLKSDRNIELNLKCR